MPRVLKQIAAPGTYYVAGPSGPMPFTITADDCIHWKQTGKEMIRERFPIRVPLEHLSWANPDIAAGDDEIKAKEVEFNKGFVTDFLLDRDKSLWCELDIPDQSLADRLETEIKFVSPRIIPSFVDGSGKLWENVIGHVALTPQPIWHQQRPFGEQMLAPPVQLSLALRGTKRAIDFSLAHRIDLAITSGEEFKRRSAASKKAWETIRRNKGLPPKVEEELKEADAQKVQQSTDEGATGSLDRRAAALKAWDTIRARRAAGLYGAPPEAAPSAAPLESPESRLTNLERLHVQAESATQNAPSGELPSPKSFGEWSGLPLQPAHAPQGPYAWPDVALAQAQSPQIDVDAIVKAVRNLGKDRHNHVELTALREQLGWAPKKFNHSIRKAQASGLVTFSAAEGRHGISEAERAAGFADKEGLYNAVGLRPEGREHAKTLVGSESGAAEPAAAAAYGIDESDESRSAGSHLGSNWQNRFRKLSPKASSEFARSEKNLSATLDARRAFSEGQAGKRRRGSGEATTSTKRRDKQATPSGPVNMSANPLDPLINPALSDKRLYERILEYLQDHVGEGESLQSLYKALGRKGEQSCEVEKVLQDMQKRGLARKTKQGWQFVRPVNFSVRQRAIDMAADRNAIPDDERGIPMDDTNERAETPESPDAGGGVGDLGTVKDYLAHFGINLPDDTDENNFLEHLQVALHALKGGAENGPPDEEDMLANAKPEEAPATVNMSLIEKLPNPLKRVVKDMSAKLQWATGQLAAANHGAICQKIDQLATNGQIAKATCDIWKKALGQKQMSLVTGGDKSVQRILDQMDLAGEIPAGTFWTKEEKTARMARAQEADKPDWAHDFSTRGVTQKNDDQDFGPMPQERVDKIMREIYGDNYKPVRNGNR
jgi:hypothetical protein